MLEMLHKGNALMQIDSTLRKTRNILERQDSQNKTNCLTQNTCREGNGVSENFHIFDKPLFLYDEKVNCCS